MKGFMSVVTIIFLATLAAAVYVVLPVLVGAMIDTLGLTPNEAGIIAAADMLGAFISVFCISFVIARVKWRVLLLGGIGVLTAADVLSGFAHSYFALLLFRVLAGLGEGALLAVANASTGETRDPDRVYALSLAGQVAFAAPVLYFLPSLLAAYGLRGVFCCLAALTFAAIFLIGHIPNGVQNRTNDTAQKLTGKLATPSVIGLLGVLSYFITQGGVWTYLDRIGASNQLAPTSIGLALSVCSVAGLCGALIAAWLGARWGRLKPIIMAAGLTVLSLVFLRGHTTFLVFAAMTSIFNFAWNFSVPYQFGALAEIDSSRRTVVLAGAAVFAGMTVGPALAAALIHNDNYQNVIWMGVSFCIASVALFAFTLLPFEARVSTVSKC